jgi:transcriptional regulator with XRE-family HTH domain
LIHRRTDHSPKRGHAADKPAALGFSLTLQQLRAARGIGMRAFARKIGIQPQQLWTWEHGRIPDPAEAAFIAGALNADYTTAQRIIGHARQATVSDLVDSDHREHAAIAWHYEHLADHTITWAPTLVPDLLRIPQHDLDLLNHPLAQPDHADAHASAMPQRRADVADPRRHYTFLIGETALQACPDHLRGDQLDHLATHAAQPNITLLLLSDELCPPGLISPFTLFIRHKATIAVASHQLHATSYLTRSDALHRYLSTATWLRKNGTTIATTRPQSLQPEQHTAHDHVPPQRAPTPVIDTPRNDLPRRPPSDPGSHRTTVTPPTTTGVTLAPQPPQHRPPAATPHHAITPARSPSTTPPAPPRPTRPQPAPRALLTLGPHVTTLRTARELDHAELAAATAISKSKLKRLEHGAYVAFSLAEVAALADTLAVARADLLHLAVDDYTLRHGPAPTEQALHLPLEQDNEPQMDWLRVERQQRDLTTTVLAWQAGIPRRTYRGLEDGEIPFTLDDTMKLADALNVSRHALALRAMSAIPTSEPRGESPRME